MQWPFSYESFQIKIGLSHAQSSEFLSNFNFELLRGNAGKDQKYGFMGVLRFAWFCGILKVPMIVFEPQKDWLSNRPTPDIMENKGFQEYPIY